MEASKNNIPVEEDDDLSFAMVILGIGGVGQVCAREAAKREYVTHLVLADLFPAAAERLAEQLREQTKATIEVVKADASDAASVAAILGAADVCVYAGLPEYNFQVMQACLETGTSYIDLAADGPGSGYQLEQLAWDERFKQAGILGIMGMGCDPGFTNIAARYAADQMDRVTRISVLDGDKSTVDFDGYCAYFSPATAIKECLGNPNYWTPQTGECFDWEPLSNKERIQFPEPVGWLDCYNVEHEEVATLGTSIGKGCEYVDFKYALSEEFVTMLRVIQKLGLASEEPVEAGGQSVVPLDLVVRAMPKPADLAGKIHGHSCIGTLVHGTKGDRAVEMFVYSLISHDEVYAEHGSQATVWQTGVPPIVAVDMMAEGLLTRTGCIPPEMIDPVPFLERLRARGMRWDVTMKTSPLV
ncbi:saccharopine dehydrogenase family protein [Brevibacillus fluminis]|uniref:saccharopine dehydrogenase family protein n=1 Tax=Brevibacillus fluminis TaxID=511487 RepID=UPI003F8B2D2F